jgi:pseudaminic acid cytidylyltransferase
MNLCVIPARGGSKRIPRKNIREFCGKPMIGWSIEAAIASKVFDAIIVSTDDDEISGVAESFGAQAPFRRPPELSNDYAATLPVIAHAIRWWEENRTAVNFVCCVYATAPFLKPEFLRDGYRILQENTDGDFAFSVTSYAFPIFRAIRLNDRGRVEMFWPENQMKRSQDLPDAWHDAGQFYWGRKKAFFEHDGVFNAKAYPVKLPRHLVQDIDTPEDWERAERMFLGTSN